MAVQYHPKNNPQSYAKEKNYRYQSACCNLFGKKILSVRKKFVLLHPLSRDTEVPE